MKKHTLLGLGLLFLPFFLNAQVADSLIRQTAVKKMQIFGVLLQHLAGQELDLTTKA